MDTPEAPHAHAHASTGRRWLDALVAFAALGISALSIVVAMRHGETMEKLVEAQSWPHVRIDNSNIYKDRTQVAITLRSAGAGPARVERVLASYGGQPVRSWVELIRACCSADPGASVEGLIAETDSAIVTGGPNGLVLLPGEAEAMLLLPLTPRNAALWHRLDKARFKLKVTVCYCSVFDECYEAEMGRTRARHVPACAEGEEGWTG